MSTTMDMPPTKMPTEGWVLIILTALGAKPLWDHLTQRKKLETTADSARAEHSQEIELRRVDAAEAEDRKLIRVLESQIKEMRGELGRLSGLVDGLRDERTQDKIVIATQAAEINALKGDLERVRADRDHYRSLSLDGQGVLARAGHTTAATQLLDEISEADEASSIQGGKAR